MIAAESAGGGMAGVGPPAASGVPSAPLSRLRGAGVDADAGLVARIVITLVALSLLVLAVALAVAGAEKNNHLTALRADGVPVKLIVTDCRGLIGGSGSNLVGYACRGEFSLGGRSYALSIPGDSLHNPGAALAGVALRGDPSVATTASALDSEQASWRVFLVPAVIVLLLALAVLALVLRRRSRLEPARTP